MAISFSVTITYNDSVRHFPLGERPITVGRDPTADILIRDPAISRQQLTLQSSGESVHVEMNAKSPNVMVRSGSARMSDEVHSGECFFVGPYRFEITATLELPEAHRRGPAEDPAGPIDLSVLTDGEHIAPRWRSSDYSGGLIEKTAPKPVPVGETTDGQPGFSPMMRILLMGFLVLIGGYLIYDFTKTPAGPNVESDATALSKTDLLASVPPISCQSETECLERAKDSYHIAKELLDASSRDLVTRYKTARLLYRAKRALGQDPQRIPGLVPLFERARADLKESFADTAFHYERAILDNQLKEQREILQTLLHLCSEDRHRFCTNIEHTFLRLPDKPG